MRLIFGIVLLLLGLGSLSCRIDALAVDPSVVPEPAGAWVRTIDGWERVDTWSITAAPPVSLHPLVVAAGFVLLSVLALAVYSPERQPKQLQR